MIRALFLPALAVVLLAGALAPGDDARAAAERVALAAPAPSLYERIDPGFAMSGALVRIGLQAGEGEVLVGARGGEFVVLDGRSGKPLFADRAPGEVRVVPMGGAPARAERVHRIQVASLASEKRARDLATRLETEHRAEASVAWEPSRAVWRVRLGAAAEPQALAALLQAVREAGHPEAWIASEPRHRDEGGTLALVDARYTRADAGADRVVFVPRGAARITVSGRPYRGLVEVLRTAYGGVQAVNELPLEEYLRGVVPEELGPAAWPEIEALKAQAIAARTYILGNLGQYAEDGYDICDTPRCQVYGGFGSEHPLSDRAVAETAGEILVWDGKPINALYTSTCGGHTEDLRVVFPEMTGDYLRGVPCVAAEESIAARRVGIVGREVVEREAEPAQGDEALWRARLVAAGLAPRALFDPAWRAAPLTAAEADAAARGLARLAGLPDPGAAPDPPARLALWRWAWGARAGAGAGLVRPGDESLLVAADDLGEIPAADRGLLAALAARGLVTPGTDGRLRPQEPPSRGEFFGWIARDADALAALPLREATLLGRTARGEVRLRERRRVQAWSLGSPAPDLLAASGGAWHRVATLDLAPGDAVSFVADARGNLLVLAAAERRAATDDRYSTKYRWTVIRERDELEKSLARVAPVGRIRDIRVLSRGVSGRVAEIEIEGTEGSARVTGFRIRGALGLLETLFDMELQRGTDGLVRRAVFRGRGWGHGVGMCQVGAYGMALEGASYREILGRYYGQAHLARPALPARR